MSHILIFDSTATVTNKGDGVDMFQIWTGAPAIRRSLPVRAYGSPDGDVEKAGIEMWLISPTSENVTVKWFLEFNNDSPQRRQTVIEATAHTVPGALGIATNSPWVREQTSEVAGSGVVNHYDVVRQATFNPGAALASGAIPGVQGKYFPMSIHCLFFRLGLYVDSTPSSTPRLLVFAVVGGYDEQDVIEASTLPWIGTWGQQITPALV